MSSDGRRHHEQTRIMLRPVGSGLPLGFFSFSIGMLLLGCQEMLLAILSTLGKPFFSVLLGLATARVALSGVSEVGAAGKGVFEAAGGCAIALTVLALYGGLALSLEDARHGELLPLFRRGTAAESFDGYERQLERLESEPSVRHQL